MTLVNMKSLLLDAQKGGYGVPAFNIHNMETIKVVLKAASDLNSPVILAATPSTVKYAGDNMLVAMASAEASRYNIPVALHMDHHTSLEEIKRGIDIGYTSVMYDGSHLSYEENVKNTIEIVKYAKGKDVSVEAELGVLSGQEDDLLVDGKNEKYTNPLQAKSFCEETSIDGLAVAIGTAHGLYKGTPKLDFERLTQIREVTTCPLVLHGASDLPDAMVTEAVKRGITKVNVATELKIRFADGLKEYFKQNPDANDPRYYMEYAKNKMYELVIHKIKLFGSENKACSK